MAREKRSSIRVNQSYKEDGDGDAQPVASGSRPTKRHAPAESDDDHDFDHDEDEDLAPVKKKAKRAAASAAVKGGKGKGRVGKLAKFNEMPLDVLGEICSHLDPLSLLYMSRTTKGIHRLLASKGSRALWISARRTVALPDLGADDVTEMAYASLVFERNCMVCDKGRAQKHDYAIRARYCQPCQKKNVVVANKVAEAIPTLHPLAISCSPFTLVSPTGVNGSQRHFLFLPSVRKISERLHALEAEQSMLERGGAQSKKGKGKARAVDQDTATPEEGIEGTPYLIYIREKRALVAKAREDNISMCRWDYTNAEDRDLAARDVSKLRTEAIDAKMVELGYDVQDVQLIYNYIYNEGKALTERTWKTISPHIIAYTEDNKTRRLQREENLRRKARRDLIDPLYQSILDSWPSDLNFPSHHTFDNFDSVIVFWEPEGVEIDDGAWNAALPEIHTKIREHQVSTKKAWFATLAFNLHIAGSPLPSHLATITPLDAPSRDRTHTTTVRPDITDAEMDAVFARFSSRFVCCDVLLPYEAMVAHRKTAHNDTGPEDPYDSAVELTRDSANFLKLLLKRLDKEELDDETAKDTDLEAAGPVFECHKCRCLEPRSYLNMWGLAFMPYFNPTPQTTGFVWSEALDHQMREHSSKHYNASDRLLYSARIKRATEEVDSDSDDDDDLNLGDYSDEYDSDDY